jgi:M6 family metalloprotease-like protein
MKVLRKSNVVFFAVTLMFLLTAFVVNFSYEGQEEKGPQYVQANPNLADIEQPDGSPLSVVAAGDEVIHYTRTVDGYTLLQGEDGYYYYAELDSNGDLVISTQKAKHEKHRSNSEQKYLKKIQKYLAYSETQKKEKKNKWKKGNGKPKGISAPQFGPIDDAFPTTGNRNMLVILGQFSDWTFVKTNSDFNNLLNVGSSSFKAFYQDNSYGALNVTTTVVGPYTINMTMSAADNNIRSYIAQLVDAANNDGVNFANFDNNNDGVMDSLYVIHAGYGEEYSGAPTYYIWSHSWDLSTYARTYDGVYISSYATSPELRNLSGSTISSIGVICHEFGHNLGAPDYYDTDDTGSGGTAWDLMKWDLMAGGSWNNNGDTPAQHNMYTKWQFGWSNPTVISSAATLSLNDTSDNNEAYRVNTTTSNEFFILENRQQVGWDAYLPGHGLLVFHIDGNMIDGLSSNTVNANPSHQGVDIEEADNLRSTSNYTGDPFPGTANKTSFTDTTTPNSKSWAGANTNKPITGISEAGGVITFDFMGGGSVTTPVANFTANDTTITEGQSVTFTDTSSNSPTSWSWSFPGGTPSSSTSQNPTVTYNTAGTYSVTLTAANSAGSDSETKANYITVDVAGVTYCTSQGNNYSYEYIGRVQVGDLDNTSSGSSYTDFTSYTAHLTAGASVSVTLTPVFPGSTYTEYWKIWIDYNGDGDFVDSGEEVFSKSGKSAVSGSFTVPSGASGTTRMRVTMKYNAAPTSCETFSYGEVEDYTVDISGGTVLPPVANFTASATTITAGQSVTFTDTSTNNPTSWAWTFTGGTPSSSTSQNPTVTYNTAGTYSVTLTATNSAGSDGETKSNYITVNPASVTYCTANSTNTNYEWISRVQIGTINNSTSKSYYTDYTSISTNGTRGSSLSVTLTPGFASSSYTEYWKIWVDYNKDGDFADSGEEVFAKSGSSAVSGSFTVSSSASTGTTRMRVIMKYSGYASYCGSFTYGEVEDYTINIQ